MKINPIFITGIFVVISAEAYSVKKGDSLSAIAKEHYGKLDKWHDLYESNKSFIQNPNLIYPGQKLSMDGKTTAADSSPSDAGILVAASNPDFKLIKSKGRSQEWRYLPKQDWETFKFPTSPQIDPDGFDKRSKIVTRTSDRTFAPMTVASDRIPIEGEIINARSEHDQIFLGEQVFIRGEEQLQVGKTYSITSGPEKIVSNRDQRVGFAYELAGTIKIIGVRDGVFIGTVTTTQRPIMRKNLLIPEVSPVNFLNPVASATIIPASIVPMNITNNSMIGEHNLIILDAGEKDGVKAGMVFRKYMKLDPNNNTVITTKDYLIEADMQVLDVKDHFSIAYVMQSRGVIHANDEVLSLMDLRDLYKNSGMQIFIQNDGQGVPLDELDQMDDSQGLGEKEDQELRQLEKVDPMTADSPSTIGNEISPNDQSEAPVNEINDLDLDTPSKVEQDHVSEPPVTPDVDKDLDAPEAEAPVENLSPPADPAPADPAPSETPAAPATTPAPESLEPPADPAPSATPAPSESPSPSPSPSPAPTS